MSLPNSYQEHIIIDGLQYCKPSRGYFQSLVDSGVTAVHVTLVYHELARETLSQFSNWNKLFSENHDLIMPVMDVDDILAAKKTGKVGIFFGAQNCSSIEDDIGLVAVMRKLGLLIMQLTYNNQSLLATGCYEESDRGLTRFGKQVIEEMNEVGMVIDMSHSSERSTLEAIEYSSRPICISHANPDFFTPSKRNKSKAVIQALAKSKGILGFSLYPFHLPNGSECTLQEFCQMIADMVELVGIEHLGVGSDLCLGQSQSVLEWMRNGRWSKKIDFGEGSSSNSGWPKPLPWFPDSSGMINIYTELKTLGFSETEVGMILGRNWFDFLKISLSSNLNSRRKK